MDMNFIPAVSLILVITTPDGEIILPIVIQTGDENTAPTMDEIVIAIDDTVLEYAEMYDVAPDKVKLLTADEAVELGFYVED